MSSILFHLIWLPCWRFILTMVLSHFILAVSTFIFEKMWTNWVHSLRNIRWKLFRPDIYIISRWRPEKLLRKWRDRPVNMNQQNWSRVDHFFISFYDLKCIILIKWNEMRFTLLIFVTDSFIHEFSRQYRYRSLLW